MTLTFTLLELLGWAAILAITFIGFGLLIEYVAAGYFHDRRHHPKGHQ